MARGKKWTVPFESLNGTTCRVDIYEENYSGSVTELSTNNANAPGVASAVPFEFQEDDSNDLTNFIRFKTGSLRLVELTYGGLNALMPRSLLDHYVEAYYGSEIVFSGYMQCQEFDNDWVAVPRVLEFPVISPLGLLDAFNFTAPQSPGLVTLGELMHEVVEGLNGGYTGVIYPVASSYEPWTDVISSTVICPFNSSFKHYDAASKLYEPKNYKYFIEGICACFGWMVHDTPTNIEFTKFEYTNGYYSRLTVAGLLNPASGWSSVQQLSDSFSSYYTNTDNNAMQSMVMPLKEIVLNLEGADINDKNLETLYSRSEGRLLDGGANYRGMRLTQVGPNVSGQRVGTAIFDTGGNLSTNGAFPIGYAKIEQGATSVGLQESWVIKYSSGWSSASEIMTVTFYGQAPSDSNRNILLKLKMERGTTLQDMQTTGYNNVTLNLVIKSGSRYFNLTNDTWSSSFTLNAITIDGQTGKVTPNKTFAGGPSIGTASSIGDVDGIMFVVPYGINAPIEVSLYTNATSGLNNNDYLRITEMSLKNPGAIDEPYNSYYQNRDHIKVGGSATGTESRDITVNFNNYSTYHCEHSFGDATNGPDGSNPTFPYMFAPLTVLTEKVKRKANTTISFDQYAALWTYWISGWRWRMIAHNFNLVDDEHQITLARSTTIE